MHTSSLTFHSHYVRHLSAAQENGRLAKEIDSVTIPQRKVHPIVVGRDEQPRSTTIETLANLGTLFKKEDGTSTSGNASGVNKALPHGSSLRKRLRRNTGWRRSPASWEGATGGVPPRAMCIGPVPASRKLMGRLGISQHPLEGIELSEAFASQALAVPPEFGITDDDACVNRNGGAIALGHPLGMFGTDITGSAALELQSVVAIRSRRCASVSGRGLRSRWSGCGTYTGFTTVIALRRLHKIGTISRLPTIGNVRGRATISLLSPAGRARPSCRRRGVDHRF
ncbi:acetyl-CoA acetyltransferase [Pararhizobium capsulatum DSM 1112]|uniref:Acetyl-CoA acetyltransferase n=1 Tax=Pararhizobium capsulatum DSM 1112 TaxID=1121113 RepID=A0ABU0BV53_9HYPH|nr:acetyl-CoA acetyltransferase [Pararhizobium capsulatum DSM 1112]